MESHLFIISEGGMITFWWQLHYKTFSIKYFNKKSNHSKTLKLQRRRFCGYESWIRKRMCHFLTTKAFFLAFDNYAFDCGSQNIAARDSFYDQFPDMWNPDILKWNLITTQISTIIAIDFKRMNDFTNKKYPEWLNK